MRLGLEKAAQAKKSAPWKVEIAARVRQETGAAIVWLAEALSIGKTGNRGSGRVLLIFGLIRILGPRFSAYGAKTSDRIS
jgi:hypothetical protein